MSTSPIPHTNLEELTIAQFQHAQAVGHMTSAALVTAYHARIDAIDKAIGLNAIIELNPDAAAIAHALDEERAARGVRGPLHGVPVLLKDNIDTGDRMQTTAGSLALVGAPAVQDATVAARLRQAGAVILGKANLSEWANMRAQASTSGWSGRGGQTRNPYALDRNPSGSSAGSAAAVSANLCLAALGTETDGSIISPSAHCGVVGIKPTVGLTSRAGVIPIAHSQDTVGPHARTVADAAALLGALTGVDARDADTQHSAGQHHLSYTQFLDPDRLRGARLGVVRSLGGYSLYTDGVFETALDVLRQQGATLVDPAEIPSAKALAQDPAEMIVLIHEFKRDLNAYLATRHSVPARTMADVIAFNRAHAAQELPFFQQEWLELAEADLIGEAMYAEALARGRRLAGAEGVDAVLREHKLDALIAPSNAPAGQIDWVNGDNHLGGSSSMAAVAGYPMVTVPAGDAFGLPIGLSFVGGAWSEPVLIGLAYAFEQASQARTPPRFLPSIQFNGLPQPRRAQPSPQTLAAHILGK